jgi:hypothetical protein
VSVGFGDSLGLPDPDAVQDWDGVVEGVCVGVCVGVGDSLGGGGGGGSGAEAPPPIQVLLAPGKKPAKN